MADLIIALTGSQAASNAEMSSLQAMSTARWAARGATLPFHSTPDPLNLVSRKRLSCKVLATTVSASAALHARVRSATCPFLRRMPDCSRLAGQLHGMAGPSARCSMTNRAGRKDEGRPISWKTVSISASSVAASRTWLASLPLSRDDSTSVRPASATPKSSAVSARSSFRQIPDNWALGDRCTDSIAAITCLVMPGSWPRRSQFLDTNSSAKLSTVRSEDAAGSPAPFAAAAWPPPASPVSLPARGCTSPCAACRDAPGETPARAWASGPAPTRPSATAAPRASLSSCSRTMLRASLSKPVDSRIATWPARWADATSRQHASTRRQASVRSASPRMWAETDASRAQSPGSPPLLPKGTMAATALPRFPPVSSSIRMPWLRSSRLFAGADSHHSVDPGAGRPYRAPSSSAPRPANALCRSIEARTAASNGERRGDGSPGQSSLKSGYGASTQGATPGGSRGAERLASGGLTLRPRGKGGSTAASSGG
mmetsp:Transcript_26066/g.98159  ORF Transcript_26066/g.98159 Transcript_26066/m.98159 type:complete len:487 (+) Transcript_26066:695-2155(+)